MNEIDPDDAITKINTYTDQIDTLLEITASDGEREKTQLETRIKGFVRAVFKDDDKKIQDIEKDGISRKSHYSLGERSKQRWYVIDLEVLKDHLISYKEELELLNQEKKPSMQPPKNIIKRVQVRKAGKKKIHDNRKIFIVHGHNEELKNKVEVFLKSLGLEPIILHKQADLGKTIIEKVEHYSDVAFAIILLTYDDVGISLGPPIVVPAKKDPIIFAHPRRIEREYGEHTARARQNVIFEFGFFIAKLGRNKVAALCQVGIERPSDIDGLLYTPVDQKGEWKKKIAKEINAAGIKIDEKFL